MNIDINTIKAEIFATLNYLQELFIRKNNQPDNKMIDDTIAEMFEYQKNLIEDYKILTGEI